jgi:spermidine/putrescine transport system permease protein
MPRNRFASFCIIIAALWLGIFAILPSALLLLVTFLTRDTAVFVALPLTLQSYIALLDPSFLKIFTDSVWMAFGTTLLCLFVGYPFAYAMTLVSRRRRIWLLLLVIIPFWTSSLIHTYALVVILKTNGLLSNALQALRLVDGPVSLLYTDTAVFIGLAYNLLPFMILPLYAAIEKLDRRLLDAATDLGAGPFNAFRHITLPLTIPGILAGCMLVFLPSLSMFYVPEVLGGSKNMLLGNFIKNQFLIVNNWPLGASGAMVMTLFMVVLIALYRWSIKYTARNDDLRSSKNLTTAGGSI